MRTNGRSALPLGARQPDLLGKVAVPDSVLPVYIRVSKHDPRQPDDGRVGDEGGKEAALWGCWWWVSPEEVTVVSGLSEKKEPSLRTWGKRCRQRP